MALKSVYFPHPTIIDGIIEIRDEENRHLVVARAEVGEKIEVFDGEGLVWTCVVTETGKRETRVRVEGERLVPAPQELILGQALIRASALELAIEKSVEVGVTRIIPFTASRSNTPSTAAKSDRWHRIVVEAAKQSKRYHLPVLDPVCRLDDILCVPAATRVVFTERGGGGLRTAMAGYPAVYLIGPEGGWTDVELQSCREAGFSPVTLGTGTLKAETAAIVGAALILYESWCFRYGDDLPNRLH